MIGGAAILVGEIATGVDEGQEADKSPAAAMGRKPEAPRADKLTAVTRLTNAFSRKVDKPLPGARALLLLVPLVPHSQGFARVARHGRWSH